MKKKFILALLIFLCFSNITVYGSFSSHLKAVHHVFVKNVKKISAKDAFFGVAICSLVGMTIKLFKQCINMRSEIFTLRNLVAKQGHFDLENLRRDVGGLRSDVSRQAEGLRLTRNRIQTLEDKHNGLTWQFQSLWKLFDQFTERQMENSDPSTGSTN